MQDQSEAAAVRRTSGAATSCATYDSAPMERRVRQVKGAGIAPAQVVTGRIKPGCTLNPGLQNRSGAVGASAPATTSNQILKCPRCNSLNTKFCYYNNYSLLQPRHFCKNCRRYWTKGGALRNVPVGGGCRKNKRSAATSTASGSGTSTVMTATKQGGMNMMIRENNVSCRNGSISTAPMIATAVHKAALQESMPAPTHTQFPPLYNYTGKSSHIQPANSLSNPASLYTHMSSYSNQTQYPLLNLRFTPLMPPHQASFHSFLNLKQAISSPNHSFNNFSAVLPPSSAPSFLSNDHISTANLDAALQAPIHDPLMGLDLINASTTASLLPLSSVTTTPSTTSIFNSTTASLLGFNYTNDQANRGNDHQLKGTQSVNADNKMSIFNTDQQELQSFGSSSSAAAACKGLQQMHAGAIMGEGQLMQLMSTSSMKDELVSDNFKKKGDDDPPATACCSNSSWTAAQRSSFLEPASGDDQPYWSCNPSTWPDDLST